MSKRARAYLIWGTPYLVLGQSRGKLFFGLLGERKFKLKSGLKCVFA